MRHVEIGDGHGQRFMIVGWHNLGVMGLSLVVLSCASSVGSFSQHMDVEVAKRMSGAS